MPDSYSISLKTLLRTPETKNFYVQDKRPTNARTQKSEGRERLRECVLFKKKGKVHDATTMHGGDETTHGSRRMYVA